VLTTLVRRATARSAFNACWGRGVPRPREIHSPALPP
jgi:7,8-dihydropterin-6-yl-methyl-4-(beta-D-ribofuranosyl)aminobenzene 5'-phosphate synthase